MKAKQKPSNGRRSQFNIQASGLSEKAYLYVEALSTKKELSQKFWEWAEREINGDYTPVNPSSESNNTQLLEQQVQLLQQQLNGFITQMQQGMTPMGGYPPMQYQQQVPYPYMSHQPMTQQGQPHQGQMHQGQMHQAPTHQPMYQQAQVPPSQPAYASYEPTVAKPRGTGKSNRGDSVMPTVSKNVSHSDINEDTDYDF